MSKMRISAICVLMAMSTVSKFAIAVDAEGLIGKTIKINTKTEQATYLWTQLGEVDTYATGSGDSSSDFKVIAGNKDNSIALLHVNSNKYLKCDKFWDCNLLLGDEDVGDKQSFLVTDLSNYHDNDPKSFALTTVNNKVVTVAHWREDKVTRGWNFNTDTLRWQSALVYEEVEISHEDAVLNIQAEPEISSQDKVIVSVDYDITEPRNLHIILTDLDRNIEVLKYVDAVSQQGQKKFNLNIDNIYSGSYQWSVFLSAINSTASISPRLTSAVIIDGIRAGDLDLDKDIDANDINLFRQLIASGNRIDIQLDFNNDGIVNVGDIESLKQQCDQKDCAIKLNLKEEVADFKAQLSIMIKDLEDSGTNVEKEKMTLHTAELFTQWAAWDKDNIATIAAHFEDHINYDADQALKLAKGLPEYEYEGIKYILVDAIETLKKVQNSEIVRRPVNLIDYSNIQFNNGDLEENGRPVFLTDYTWKAKIPKFSYYGNTQGVFIAPSFLNESGQVPQWRKNNLLATENNEIGRVFISHQAIPEWMNTRFPDFKDTVRIFNNYDTDHPQAKPLFSSLFSEVVPLMKGKEFTRLGYMLFNEPSFFSEEGVWNTSHVSQYTLNNYETWLENKHGDVASLNALWNTSFTSFDDVNEIIPMKGELQGSPRWLDWMTFNNHRITQWHKFLNDEIKKHDPAAKTHIKLMPFLWAEKAKDHGMDFESLLYITDIIGFDAGMQNGNDFTWLSSEWWDSKYSIQWTTALMTFDFMTSVRPNQVMYDSENHFVNKSDYQNPTLAPEYIRAAFWAGFTHGMDATNTWVWTRNEDGSMREGVDSEYVTSVGTQPKILNEVTATIMDLNSFSPEIVALQKMRKSIRLFYSASAAINDKEYMDTLRELYESAYFEGGSVGFVTETILAQQQANWDVVLVKNSPKITNEEFVQLQAYLDDGGTIIIDTISAKYNEYGIARSTQLVASNGVLLNSDDNIIMTELAVNAVSKAGNSPIVNIVESKNGQISPVGSKKISWRAVKTEDGNSIVSLINFGKETIQVEVQTLEQQQYKTSNTVNMLTEQSHQKMIDLAPYAVAFVKVLAPLKGDFDNDQDVDKDDVSVFYQHIRSNTLNDLAYDFNADGQLSTRDVRGLMSLCTRPRCVTE